MRTRPIKPETRPPVPTATGAARGFIVPSCNAA